MPKFPFQFHPIRENLYSPDELVAGFDPERPASYAETRDFRIYRQYVSAGRSAPSDYFPAMMQSLHDNSITLAIHDYLETSSAKAVGIMGGHELDRDTEAYRRSPAWPMPWRARDSPWSRAVGRGPWRRPTWGLC